PLGLLQAEDRRAGAVRVGLGLRAGGDGGSAGERGGGHGGVVDDPVDDHVGHRVGDRGVVGRDLGDLPGELVLTRAVVRARVDPDVVEDHVARGETGVAHRTAASLAGVVGRTRTAADSWGPRPVSAVRIAARLARRWIAVAWAARVPSPSATASAMRR